MTTGRRARGDERIGDMLARAADHGDPHLDRLVEAVPGMLAEARRRRTIASTPAARVSAAGWVWVPRLAALTVLLALAALIWPSRPRGGEMRADEAAALNRWIVTGQSTSSVEDPILDALVR